MLVEPRTATGPMSADVVGAAANPRTGNKEAAARTKDFICNLRLVL
jgi:hypothetical protein